MKYYVYSILGGIKSDGFVGVDSHLIRVKLDRGNTHRPKYPRGMTRYIYDIVKVVSEDKVPGIELLVNLSIKPKDVLDFQSDEAAMLWFKLEHGRQP